MNWKDLDVRGILGIVIVLLVILLAFTCYRMIIKLPNVETRILFGFAILLALGLLALVIALGHVTQDTSYGLDIVLSCLATLSGGFAQWAFSKLADKPKPEDKEPKP